MPRKKSFLDWLDNEITSAYDHRNAAVSRGDYDFEEKVHQHIETLEQVRANYVERDK